MRDILLNILPYLLVVLAAYASGQLTAKRGIKVPRDILVLLSDPEIFALIKSEIEMAARMKGWTNEQKRQAVYEQLRPTLLRLVRKHRPDWDIVPDNVVNALIELVLRQLKQVL